MSEKEKTEAGSSKSKDAFQAEFDALPLDEKFSRLFKMEAVTLGETINYVVDNSSKAFNKAVEAINDLGRKAQADSAEKKEAAKEPKAKKAAQEKEAAKEGEDG